jgi:hypothetical protein
MSKDRDGIDFGKVRTVPFSAIRRKVSVENFARPVESGTPIEDFLSSLPSILVASDLRELQSRILEARTKDRPVILMIGAHVIKCGLSPILIDLIERGIVTAIAMNGAGAIHDFEIAFFGETSEEVGEGLVNGTFGMSEETGLLMNRVINESARNRGGMGRALGDFILEKKAEFSKFSLMAATTRADIPVTVHVAIGTDVIHQHPSCDGSAVGSTTYEDFRHLCGIVARLEGGVIINIGSAVILPETFLKALCVARNLGHEVTNFTTADFDMLRRYRPMKNVVERPTLGSGRGFAFTGHHEIMIPLLAAGLVRRSLDKKKNRG